MLLGVNYSTGAVFNATPVRNYAIQSTGSSIVYMLTTGLPWQQNNTIATTHTECCVALCNNKGGHLPILPWSQPSWIRQWILVINLNGTNGSRRSRLTEIHTHDVTQSLCL